MTTGQRTCITTLMGISLALVLTTPVLAHPSVSQNAVSANTLALSDGEDTKAEAYEDTELYEEAETGVTGFVTRLYKVCLDRDPDEEGLNYWVGRLKSGEETGCSAAYGFIFSKEFQNKNLCNACYVKQLYKAFMGREYDQGGFDHWTNELKTGKTREEVFNGFVLSDEFKGICEEYGITIGEAIKVPEYGTVPHGPCSVCGEVDGVTAFVTRLYSVCFGREPDQGGLDYWTEKLWSHEMSGADVASGFVFSDEFTNMNTTDAEFIKYLYLAFFDRNADDDPEGFTYWQRQMYSYGLNRSHVFAGFVNSQEFQNLCNRYGIVQGSYTPVNDKLTPQSVREMSWFARWALVSGGKGYTLDSCYMSKEETEALQTQITVPVWDFASPTSMEKVTKSVTLTINKNIAEYTSEAFQAIYASPDKPVISPSHTYCYYYRQNVNNRSRLSTHSYGIAIDINSTNNLNGTPMVTKAAWEAMDESNVRSAQKKAYTIYEGSTIYNILYNTYYFDWGGYYGRTPDAMHFEFCN